MLAALDYLQLPVREVPRVQGWSIPTVMIAEGVLLGIVLAVAAKFIAGAAARSRGAAARKRLKSAVAVGAEELVEPVKLLVVEPVELEVSRLASFTLALAAAL